MPVCVCVCPAWLRMMTIMRAYSCRGLSNTVSGCWALVLCALWWWMSVLGSSLGPSLSVLPFSCQQEQKTTEIAAAAVRVHTRTHGANR